MFRLQLIVERQCPSGGKVRPVASGRCGTGGRKEGLQWRPSARDAFFAEVWPVLIEDAIDQLWPGFQPAGDAVEFRARVRLDDNDAVMTALAIDGAERVAV
jgi:hypothetical protein